MYNVLISAKKDLNIKLIEENKNKACEAEYKMNINLLAGKLKNKLFPIIFTEDANERKKLWENIHRTIRRYLIKVKKKPKTKRKKETRQNKIPIQQQKKFLIKINKNKQISGKKSLSWQSCNNIEKLLF